MLNTKVQVLLISERMCFFIIVCGRSKDKKIRIMKSEAVIYIYIGATWSNHWYL